MNVGLKVAIVDGLKGSLIKIKIHLNLSQMFHTTPNNEAEVATGMPVRLMPSHGCIHLKPNDRNRVFTIGAFKRGTSFTVYKCHERYKKN